MSELEKKPPCLKGCCQPVFGSTSVFPMACTLLLLALFLRAGYPQEHSVSLPSKELAWELYARARAHHFGTGGVPQDSVRALALYRDSAALHAGPGSGASYAALARLVESGWDGRVPGSAAPAEGAPQRGGDAGGGGAASGAAWGMLSGLVSGELFDSASEAWMSSEAIFHWLLARLWRLVDFYGPPLVPAHARPGYASASARRAQAHSLAHRLSSLGTAANGYANTAAAAPALPSPALLIPQDFSVAAALWRSAAANGSPSGHFTLSALYSVGLFGFPMDATLASLHLHFSASAAQAQAAAAAAVQQPHGPAPAPPPPHPSAAGAFAEVVEGALAGQLALGHRAARGYGALRDCATAASYLLPAAAAAVEGLEAWAAGGAPRASLMEGRTRLSEEVVEALGVELEMLVGRLGWGGGGHQAAWGGRGGQR